MIIIVSGQLKQTASLLNKKRDKENKEETKDEIPSTDSEVFVNFDRRNQGNKISQNKVQLTLLGLQTRSR